MTSNSAPVLLDRTQKSLPDPVLVCVLINIQWEFVWLASSKKTKFLKPWNPRARPRVGVRRREFGFCSFDHGLGIATWFCSSVGSTAAGRSMRGQCNGLITSHQTEQQCSVPGLLEVHWRRSDWWMQCSIMLMWTTTMTPGEVILGSLI